MFAVCKWLLVVLIASWSSVGLAESGAENGGLVGGCNSAQECVVSIHIQGAAQHRLCGSSDFSALWIRGREKYLIQCRSGDTAEDNVVWVVDLGAKFFSRLNYGRFITKSAIERNPNLKIPDKFSSRDLCGPIDMTRLKTSDFLLLDKSPTDSDEDSYCYDPTYLEVGGGKLTIAASRGPVTRGDLDHAMSSVSASDRKRLAQVVDLLRQWEHRQ